MLNSSNFSLGVRRSRLRLLGMMWTFVAILFMGFTTINVHSAFAQSDTYVISSGSMDPALKLNDVVIIDRSYPFEDVQVGDIILFMKPEGADRIIVHRVVEIDIGSGGERIMTTKGDANPSPIPGTDYPVTEDLYQGRVTNIIPQVGVITKFISPPVNYFIMIIVWGTIILVLYRRSKMTKMVAINAETGADPTHAFDNSSQVIAASKLVMKDVIPSKSIRAQDGRDFRWSWMILGIIFAWPAAIAYYVTSKRNTIFVTITPKPDGQGSAVSIQAIGHKAQVIANEISKKLHGLAT